MATIIRANGTTTHLRLTGAESDLALLKEAVGGFIEAFPLLNAPDDMAMYGNEDGRRLGLPENANATFLAALGYPIVGDVVYGTRKELGFDHTDEADDE